MKKSVLFIWIVAGGLWGCESEGHKPRTEVEAQAAQRLSSWQTALAKADVELLGAHYAQTEDLVVMWPGTVPGGDGSESVTWAWEVEAEAQKALIGAVDGAELVVEESRMVELSPTSALIMFTGVLALSAKPDLWELPVRGTLVLTRQGDKWLIVHEHLSQDPAVVEPPPES